MTGVETVEFDSIDVAMEAFRVLLGNDDDCGEISEPKGVSFESACVGVDVGVWDEYMSLVRCCSFLKLVPAI